MKSLARRPVSKQSLIKGLRDLTGRARNRDKIIRRKGDLLQIAFLFDTTGSMYSFFERCKTAIAEIVRRVAEKHSYCQFCYVPYKNHQDERCFDGTHPFFSTGFFENPLDIQGQLDRIGNSGGGDGLCALEDVFHYLATELKWDRQATKAVVMIGDMPPHGVLDSIGKCPHEFDYKLEVEALKRMGVKIYSVFCFDDGLYRIMINPLDGRTGEHPYFCRKTKIASFYQWVAELTSGKFLPLTDIDDLVDLLVGICMKETGHLDEFIKELSALKGLAPSKKRLLLELKAGS